MPSKKRPVTSEIVPREFASADEIDRAVRKLERRLTELNAVDLRKAIMESSGEDDVVRSNIRETIRDVFGELSPEFREHQHINIWAGPLGFGMSRAEVLQATERGRVQVATIITGLISRLYEKREELAEAQAPVGETIEAGSLHPRIAEVANDLFADGYHWEAVFAAAKALIHYVKERSGCHDLDGAPLMRTVFSRNKPMLVFNDLENQTDGDEQEGMMHLFEGAVLALRNPGGHSFPEGSVRRARDYVELLSSLAFRVQESRKPRK